MSKSPMPGIPGVNAMSDTLDFFKNMWGNVPGMNLPGMNIPSMVMPSLSVEEIDKQIKDLKAVESWLSLNMNMLQGTIQALEVQRTTISTFQTMGESFTAAMQPPAPPQKTVTPERSAFASPFTSAPAKPAEKPAAAKPAVVETPKVVEKPAATEAAASAEGGQDGAIPPLANPALWWNMLQDQFKQAVDTAAAMTPEAPGAASDDDAKSAKAKKAKADAMAAPRKRKAPPKA